MATFIFNVGDVVILKSGGPAMTVREIYQNGWVRTNWFAKSKLLEGDFVPENIRPWKAEDGGQGE